MAVLWRRGKGKPRNLEEDAQVVSDIERLKHENRAEYGGLAWLAGVDENDGLARLPLALVQAGSFIRNKAMSFEAYAVMYRGQMERFVGGARSCGGTLVSCTTIRERSGRRGE